MPRPARSSPGWPTPGPTVVPVLAVVALALTWGRDLGAVPVGLVALVLAGAVLAAVQHAEVIAHRLGEPFGSLVLAVAVTVIEVALIVTLMASGGAKAESLARDTVFAAVMITMQRHRRTRPARRRPAVRRLELQPRGHRRGAGHRGLARHAEPGAADLHLQRAGPAVLPGPARVRRGRLAGALRAVRAHPDRAAPRLLPAGDARPARWRRPRCTPTRRRPAPPGPASACCCSRSSPSSGWPRSSRPSIEAGVKAVGFPPSFVGVVIALLVLLPETLAAVRAAHPRPGADQPEPVLRLGDGQHRPDHPGDRGRLDLARRARCCSASGRCRSCCWR